MIAPLFFYQVAYAEEEYDLIVSPDGKGDVKTVSAAIARVPEDNKKRFAIFVRSGVYDEQVRIPANKPYISLIGENAKTTKLQFRISNKMAGSTSAAYAFYVGGHGFFAKNLTFENTFGLGSQAVAVLAEADRVVFSQCRFIGWQDTLYAKGGRQFYRDCYIEGHVDFIFGQAAAIFENCVIHSKGDGYIAAPMRFSEQESSGFVFYKSKLTSEKVERGVYLGRPWRDYGRTVFVETEMGAHIKPEGWHHWEPHREKTAFFAEYGSKGDGGDPADRVKWAKLLSKDDAALFLPEIFLKGRDGWDPGKNDFDWQEKTKPDWSLVTWANALKQQPLWYQTDEAARIGDQIVLFQKENGGWEKNVDMSAMLTLAEREKLMNSRAAVSETTIDNRATYSQLEYLAKLISGTLKKSSPPSGHQKHLTGFFQGFDYLLSSQYENGGFPQIFPLKDGYYSHITYNDDAMIGVLELLRNVAERNNDYIFVDEKRQEIAKRAVEKGLQVILRTQVKLNGEKTAWCAQHDEVTLKPASARNFEPVSLSGSESVGIVRFLMKVENPSPEIIDAIESAVNWFERSKINGIRIETVPVKNSPRGLDRVVVGDKNALPLWARFYDIKTNRPIFTGRDRVAKYRLADIEIERRTGYAYYTDEPRALLEKEYPKWKRRMTR